MEGILKGGLQAGLDYRLAAVINAIETPQYNHAPQTLVTIAIDLGKPHVQKYWALDDEPLKARLITTVGMIAIAILIGSSFGCRQKIHLKGYSFHILDIGIQCLLKKFFFNSLVGVVARSILEGQLTFARESLKLSANPGYDPLSRVVGSVLFSIVEIGCFCLPKSQKFLQKMSGFLLCEWFLSLVGTNVFCSLTGRVSHCGFTRMVKVVRMMVTAPLFLK